MGSRIPQEGFYYVGDWGPCSATCGRGIETRPIQCVYIQAYTSKKVPLPEYECRGQIKETSYRECQAKPCSSNEATASPTTFKYIKEKSQRFRWDYGKWSQCSASCLGGKQRSTLRCVDVARNIPVGWSFCDARQRPVDVRPCNTHPCPSTWEVGEFSSCTQTCGSGVRYRKVRCTHTSLLSNGRRSITEVNENLCRGRKPEDRETCAVIDCPPSWKAQNWYPCSATCGEGVKTRVVFCEQKKATGEVVHLNASVSCSHLEKPASHRVCNLGECAADGFLSDRALQSQKSFFDQKENLGKIDLEIPQRAILFEGTNIKIKCPIQHYPRNKIRWLKDGMRIINNDHIRVSSNGRLRIFNATNRDAGVYSCAGDQLVHGNATLKFKPNIKTQKTSTYKGKISNRTEADLPFGKTVFNSTDDYQKKPVFVDKYKLQEVLGQSQSEEDVEALKSLFASPENVQFLIKFVAGDWSTCSQRTCEVVGFQRRNLKCRIASDEYTAPVSDNVCESFGISKPPEVKRCKAMRCPKWKPSSWSECSEMRCLEYKTSVQKRTVKCVDTNGTEVDASLCDKKTRPKLKRKCLNANCTAVWKPSDWSACTRTCDDGGIQLRIVHCVWNASGRPAKNCNSAEQPKLVRKCMENRDLPSCRRVILKDYARSPEHPCIDKFRYCDIIKIFRRCDAKLLEKCCYSCNYYRYKTSPNVI